MKKKILFFSILLTFSLFSLNAQNAEEIETEENSENLEINENKKNKEFLPQIVNSFMNLNIVYDAGPSYCQLSRIEILDDRSNFVRETMMVGPYFQMQTVDFSFLDYIFKVSAYYPVYNAFNGMKQKPRNMFNYALNTYLGAIYTDTQFGYLHIGYSLGFHYMFQVTDEWFMHYVGLGGIVALEVPLTKNFTIVDSYFFSIDNPNLGKNKSIQPFNAAYQFQIDLGLRYCKRAPNSIYALMKKE